MASKSTVMIIAHFCDVGTENSNNRFNYIANMLTKDGFDVELVTSSFSHRDKKQRKAVLDETLTYKTTLIYEPSYKKNISLKRLFASHRIMADNLRKYLKNCSKPDLIYCAIPSINVAEVASRYAKKEKIPFVIDVQDLWPEAYHLIIKNDKFYRFATYYMKKRVDRVYADADEIVSVSNTYAKRAKSVNVKCTNPLTVYLGTDRRIFDANVDIHRVGFSKELDEVWVGYCGTLGSSYDLSVVLQALKKVIDKGYTNVCLIVMGSGPLENAFQSIAKELSIPCIFTGKLHYAEMCAQLAACDIAVNPIAKGAAQSIINKHADYAMAGLPVVNTQECPEYRNLITEYQCGINCGAESVDEVADALLGLIKDEKQRKQMGSNSRKMAEELFDRAVTYKKIVGMIEAYDTNKT